jgi:hypothetical protein
MIHGTLEQQHGTLARQHGTLSTFSKIEAGQMSISIEALNPAQLGQELKSMFDPLIAEKPIDLCLEQDDAVAEIQSDKAKIHYRIQC